MSASRALASAVRRALRALPPPLDEHSLRAARRVRAAGRGLMRPGLVRSGLMRSGLVRSGLVRSGLSRVGPRAGRVEAPDGDRALRRRLVAEGAARRIRHPEPGWERWVNTALLSDADVEEALARVRRCGLPPHEDRPKNWDLLVALGVVLRHTSRPAAVLDMGATQYSRLLPWLFLYGYRDLHGVDLVYRQPVNAGPIRYERMDLTATTFADGTFDAVTCLSVIEHGVDREAYLREAARLLRPGGVLVTSVDFWGEPVDVGGQEAYGVPITILTPRDVADLVTLGERYGLEPVRPLDLRCAERVVTWARFDLRYTFANVVLRRR